MNGKLMQILGNIKDFYISNEHIRGVDFVLCCWLELGSLDGGCHLRLKIGSEMLIR